MKRNLTAIAASIVLAFVVSPAMAQTTSTITQQDNNHTANVNQIVGPVASINNSTINQSGAHHEASVYQAVNSSFATATINQTGGSYNIGNVEQANNTGVSATIGQQWGGNNNEANVKQAGVIEGNAVVYQKENNNVGNIYQHDGSNLDAGINLNNPPDGEPREEYGENGSFNTAYIDQTGSKQKARIYQQDGAHNTANIGQVGMEADALIDQSGDNNLAVISQNGTGLAIQARITQNGIHNQAFTNQSGSNLVSNTTQIGNFNVANVWQH